eukprot:TRINITY_DN37485_c0_g1_i1.p1 TRINITY_DN37485_c0_g1~~TRINITY_DN37485_c0_g1_i1.p1  ORF type:complete len:113 (+),score=27.58 TRINITY_DN37485_c0_g1_i1:50-340(+)
MEEEISFKFTTTFDSSQPENKLSAPWLKVDTQLDQLSPCVSPLSGLSPAASDNPSVSQEGVITGHYEDSDFDIYEDSDQSSIGDVLGCRPPEDDDD